MKAKARQTANIDAQPRPNSEIPQGEENQQKESGFVM
jgi:hypothetical protein